MRAVIAALVTTIGAVVLACSTTTEASDPRWSTSFAAELEVRQGASPYEGQFVYLRPGEWSESYGSGADRMTTTVVGATHYVTMGEGETAFTTASQVSEGSVPGPWFFEYEIARRGNFVPPQGEHLLRVSGDPGCPSETSCIPEGREVEYEFDRETGLLVRYAVYVDGELSKEVRFNDLVTEGLPDGFEPPDVDVRTEELPPAETAIASPPAD